MISQTVREALQRFVPAEDLHMEEPMKTILPSRWAEMRRVL